MNAHPVHGRAEPGGGRGPSIVPPSRLTAQARRDWVNLATPTERPLPFEPAMTANLPVPVRRWLNHAIRPGTPLYTTVLLSMRGRIKIGRWWPFEATQILRPLSGFVWAANARVAGVPIRGFDRCRGGDGEMRWRLLGAVPVLSATGPDLTRSASGRLAGEFVLVPAVALSRWVTWEPVDDEHAIAHVDIAGTIHSVTLAVSASGALTTATLPRWGNPDRGAFDEHLFGVEVHREASRGGYTIPVSVSAGWWYGTDRWAEGEFIRFTLNRFEHF
jgi:hypothetical protein